ncbi:MAG: CPBP family intramembrane metalloprotease [Planctomycetes bacterium]|nr:CPBP family intramembrane metalloprotease [Planctomycetota bacterium]
MAPTPNKKKSPTGRGLLARPLEALVFLLPLIAFYGLFARSANQQVIAFHVVRVFFELFGEFGRWAPGIAVVVVLIATHAASGEKWRVRWSRIPLMYVEAALLALPLLLLGRTSFVGGASSVAQDTIHAIALGVGAGVYEEFVFRLVLITVLMMVGVDLLKHTKGRVAVFAIIVSSLAFAGHHHQPIGAEPFEWTAFAFRSIAGVYLAGVFWVRGYASAAGAHAAYNVLLIALARLATSAA